MTDDKFILMDLNDEKTSSIAEVLKSKTAKKILDYLGDVREASEKDIADKLNQPINTVEYNLKKLINSGFVKKTGNFFWSVKGKKIPTYKLARKHIVISPGKKPTMNLLKTIIPVIVIAGILLALALLYLPENQKPENIDNIKKFNSIEELKDFLKKNSDSQEYYMGGLSGGIRTLDVQSMDSVQESAAPFSKLESSASDFSLTNIQVEGVDEADIVKNDGKYIFIVSNNNVFIIDAFPPENMEIASKINFTNNEYISEIFIQENKLVVFSNSYGGGPELMDCIGECPIRKSFGPTTSIYIYDISDKENPEIDKTISTDGDYIDSRMIGDYVYLISNKYAYLENPQPPIYWADGVRTEISVADVAFFPYQDSGYTFTTISAVNLKNEEFTSKVFLTGYSSTIYVSKNNIYLTGQKRQSSEDYLKNYIEEIAIPLLPDNKQKFEEILKSNDYSYTKIQKINNIVYDHSLKLKGDEKEKFDSNLNKLTENFEIFISKKYQKTIVHKININKESITYQGSGEVPGYILNQFSIDEYNGNLRITTTTGEGWRQTSLNHLFVLDKDLEIIGSVEDLAQGERIYSTRFMGDRAYMVTFRQVDPLYVIDLSSPSNPKVLGYLKVTGYSSYLHPYDENHLIGIGMEATEEGRVQGLKIALFDVSDVKNPLEISKYEIGKEDSFKTYSYSDALYDHKAFLFNKEKELLVIPVSYTKYMSENYMNPEYWQGAFVFRINLEGIKLKGRISHSESNKEYWGDYVRRSLYMDDFLYTISNYKIKANLLTDISEIKELQFLKPEYIDYKVSSGLVESSII